MEWNRVLAVTGPDGTGSGYVVAPRLMLTSGHTARTSVTLFRPGRPEQFSGTVVWRGTPGGRDDAALVLVDDSAWVPVPGDVPWGRTVTHRTGIECACWGVPNLVQHEGAPVEVSQLSGRLNAGDRMVGDRYVMTIDGHPPDGTSPWGGMSGAALFCGDALTGVIATDPTGRQHAALEAVPAYVLLRDPDFRARLAEHGGSLRCEGVELRELDDPSARRGAVALPAGLLAARAAVVPFLGREEQLDELHAWASRPGTGVWLLHGPGGQGKTRLAQQFGERLAGEGWAVVWPRAGAKSLAVLGDVVVPMLVVVDYAEGRPAQLAKLLGELGRPGQRLKLLLLARTAGDWWRQLAATSDTVGDLIDAAEVRHLPELAPDGVDLYAVAVDAYATALPHLPGMSDVDWPAIAASLEHRVEGDTALSVQMTALADLLDAASTSDGSTSRRPEDRLLDHERRLWWSAATAHGLLPGLSKATLTDAIATVTLIGPPERRDADTFLTRVPGLADQPQDRRDTVRAWLTSLYPAPGPTAFGSLQPDRLAERLIGQLALDQDRRCVVEALAPNVSPDEAVSLLTVCARAPGAAEELIRWCVENAGTLAVPAVAVAPMVESPEPLVAAIERIAHESTDRELLRQLGLALPEQTEVLAGVALTVAEALLPYYRDAAASDPEHYTDALAMALCGLSDRMSRAGRHEDALATVTEGVELLRQVAADGQELGRAQLGVALERLANRLRDVGRWQEAVDAIAEATGTMRELAAERPEVYTFDLADCLNTLSICLATVGRLEESMTSLTEAVDAFRRLAAADPTYRPPLAQALHNLANRCTRLGRHEEALTAITESVEIRRALATPHPDAFLPELAIGLNTLAIVLGDAGQHEPELAAITEAVGLFRELAAARPGVHDNDLARTLHNLSRGLVRLDRRQEALTAIAEAVEIRGTLAAHLPDAYRADYATSLHEFATQCLEAGAAESALPVIAECVQIRFELAQALPEAHVHDLVASVQTYAECCIEAGRPEHAVTAIDQLVDLRRQIAEVEDDHATQDPQIEHALSVRAQLLEEIG